MIWTADACTLGRSAARAFSDHAFRAGSTVCPREVKDGAELMKTRRRRALDRAALRVRHPTGTGMVLTNSAAILAVGVGAFHVQTARRRPG
jgi:hypothetical protein